MGIDRKIHAIATEIGDGCLDFWHHLRKLVIHDENGYIFPSTEPLDLADQITKLIDLTDEERLKMGHKSQSLIYQWLDRDLGSLLATHLDAIYQARS